jgi:hypothetical protein
MKKEHTSHKRQSSRPSTKHTPDLFQPRPFAPTPETQTPTTQTPDLNGPISGPSLRTFSIQDPNGPRRQPIQPKLTIGAPGDKYEQEADRVASQVVQQIHAPQTNAPLQRDALDANKLQMRPILQRNTPEEDELQMRPTIEAVSGGAASESLESAISQARGSGQSLDPNLQQQMGQAMGADFSGVNIHTDSQSDQLNRSIQAKAFTTGQDIFFRQGSYQPGSRDGQELIAHELTHVVQQNGEGIQRQSDLKKEDGLQRKFATNEEKEGSRFISESQEHIQREWLDTETPNLKQWDHLRKGVRWYYNETNGLMHFKIEDLAAIPNIKARIAVTNAANQEFTYQQWIDAGWVEKEGEVLEVSEKVEASPPDFSGPTSGVEIENPASFQIRLENPLHRGVMAEVVSETGEVLADITTDMGSNPYTIENRTRPVVMADQEGLTLRKNALTLAKEAIEKAGAVQGGSAIQPVTKDKLKLVVKQGGHTIIPTSAQKNPSVQVTQGASWSDMVADAPRLTGILKEAGGRWMRYYGTYANSYALKYTESGKGASVIYGMLASLLHFYMYRIDESMKKYALENRKNYDEMGSDGIGGKGVTGGDLTGRPDLVDPKEKNSWGLLPKTSPARWLEGIESSEDVANIKNELRNAPSEVNPVAWKVILQEVLAGNNIAGHPVPKFTIKKEAAFAFEIRTPSQDDRAPYGI